MLEFIVLSALLAFVWHLAKGVQLNHQKPEPIRIPVKRDPRDRK